MALGIQNFMGSHVYIVVGSLIYIFLEKIMMSLEEHLLSPFINILLGEKFFNKLKWQISLQNVPNGSVLDYLLNGKII